MRLRAAILVPLLAASACGPQVYAPSLAPRAGEGRPVELPDPAREAATPVDPALAQRLATLAAAADEGDRAFAQALGVAERAVAAEGSAPAGSEAWTAAQQALSTLEIARGPVREAAAGIAALRQEPAALGTGSRAAIDAAAAKVDALDAGEAQATAALGRRLR